MERDTTGTQYDVAIIGGGPIGLACGIAAARAGLSHVILEQGCLAHSLYNYPLNMTFFSTADRLEIGEIPFSCTQPKPGRAEALEYYRRCALHFRLNLRLYERVLDVKGPDGSFVLHTGKAVYHARKVVVATGFYDIPNRMGIAGEDLPHVSHYYRDPYAYAFQKVVVVGASNSAVDAALECWRRGAEVSMVVRGSQIGERVKYWVRPDILNRIEEGSIRAFFNSRLLAIEAGRVQIQSPGETIWLANDFVLALTGYLPDFNLLRQLGIQLDTDESCRPQYDPQSMETNRKGMYLAGVVCGGTRTHEWFIENSRLHAGLIMAHITGQA